MSRVKACVNLTIRGAIALLTILAILTLAVMLYVPPAKGETLLSNHPSCLHLGSISIDAMALRDNGVKWPDFEGFIRESFVKARRNPASYVQSDADETYVIAALKSAWDSKLKPEDAATNIYNACMAKRI